MKLINTLNLKKFKDTLDSNVIGNLNSLTTTSKTLAEAIEEVKSISASSSTSMKIYNGLASVNFQDSWIDPTQTQSNAIKLLHDTAETDAKGQPWELLVDITIAVSPNLEKIFGAEGLLLITPIEEHYHKIEFYNKTKGKTAVGLYNDADGSYVDVKYIALETDLTGAVHYEGLPSIGIPADILFMGKTAQEILDTIVLATHTTNGDNSWTFATAVSLADTPITHGVFGDGYIAIDYVGQGHHVCHFYSDDDKIYIASYNGQNQPRVDYQQIQFVDQLHHTIITQDIGGTTPSKQDCVLALMKMPNYDWEQPLEFRLKSTDGTKYFRIEYHGTQGDSQSVPGIFRVFTSIEV